MALVVSCALIASSQLQSEESVLFGLGSGEEQVRYSSSLFIHILEHENC